MKQIKIENIKVLLDQIAEKESELLQLNKERDVLMDSLYQLDSQIDQTKTERNQLARRIRASLDNEVNLKAGSNLALFRKESDIFFENHGEERCSTGGFVGKKRLGEQK